MRFSPLFLALPVCLVTGAAVANPATPEGAAALTTTFQTYLGTVAGVVTVQPEGEIYGVKLNFAPLLMKLPAEIQASVTPIEFKLTDNGDGTWEFSEDQSISATFKAPGEAEMSLYIAHMASTGTFDSALGVFSASSGDASDISFTETTRDGSGGMTTTTYQVASLHSETSAVANAQAGADISTTYVMNDISEVFDMPAMGEGAAPVTLTVRAKSYAADATITGLRPDALYKLLAFVVANPSAEAMDAGWPMLKPLLTSGLPVFEHVQSKDKMLGISVDSPLGNFGLAEAGIQIEMNGFVADGMVREAISLTGLTLPEGLVPDWAAGLVPHRLSLDMKLAGFDAASGVLKAMDMVDATRNGGMVELPENDFLKALLPSGAVGFTLAPGSTTAPLYTLVYEGSMTAGPGVAPRGVATITMTGLQAVRDAVKSAPPDMGMQAAPVLGMAEGIAKKGANGALIWELELTEAGALLVNGTDLAAMGGQ